MLMKKIKKHLSLPDRKPALFGNVIYEETCVLEGNFSAINLIGEKIIFFSINSL
jgi:hypothetical protein